ncbi:DUF262 domain-containing protein [Candidatus Rariloculus sp.]|uniref:DUF262 domain-containing protein n=1 Tax=Candidatus Rariloculus sp. TaxID=3101265 RepID=UPI003D14D756
MIDIQPQHLTLAKLLDGRLFEIPNYQRAYSWTSRERQDLFEDIESVFAKNFRESHFMATIVCLRRKSLDLGTDVYDQLDIVDGQQRVTTLVLMLNAIKHALNSKKSKQKRVRREIEELLVKVDGDNLLLLQTNHDTSHHFADYLRAGLIDSPNHGKTLADRELLTAIIDCRNFVDRWIDNDRRLIDLYACMKNRLTFILHEISDEKLVYTVFEVLNSRGIEVSWIDRLKSILMGKAFELKRANRDRLIRDLHTIWCDIYTQIGLHQGLSTEALRFAATLYQSNLPYRPLSERDAVDELRAKAIDSESIRRIARWLLRVTEACDEVISNRRQNAVTRISQARLLAVAIYLRDDICDADRHEILSRWEKISFRIYGMLGRDARTGVGDYVRLAWRISQNDVSVEEIHAGIKQIGEKLPIAEAVDALRSTNCYDGWQDELRYFMFRYEEHLAKEEGIDFQNEQWERIWEASPSNSIEHIIPQSKAPDEVKHMLGNLMVLPPNLNSKLQDKAPKVKREAYRKTGLLSAIEVASRRRWTSRTVREREAELLDWALSEWAD